MSCNDDCWMEGAQCRFCTQSGGHGAAVGDMPAQLEWDVAWTCRDVRGVVTSGPGLGSEGGTMQLAAESTAT